MRPAITRFALPALIALLSACGGGGGTGSSSAAPPGSNGGGTPMLPASIKAEYGSTSGVDDSFTPNDGNAPAGGNGEPVDGIPCKTTMDDAHYHVHVFVGIIANASLIALPDGAGMVNPGPDSSADVTSTAKCFYYLHTHDAAGIVHVEDPSTLPRTRSLHSFGQFLAIWGQPLSANGIGPYSGPVKIYTSGAKYRGQGPQTVSSSTYAQYSGDPHTIPLYGHEVIWIEVGPTFVDPKKLPAINFSY